MSFVLRHFDTLACLVVEWLVSFGSSHKTYRVNMFGPCSMN